MVSFLFWNVNERPQPGLIRHVCDQHDIDLVALAEFGEHVAEFLAVLNVQTERPFSEIVSPATRVRMFTRLPPQCIQLMSDDERIFVRRVRPPIGCDVILVAVHLRSKLRTDERDQVFEATRLIRAIEAAEKEAGHSRTIIIGDLNMNPFETGLVAADALHAVMDKRIARGIGRTVDGLHKKYFYNPMWRFYGNGNDRPRGTYFRKDNAQTCYFWNLFDQVLVRPELVDYLDETKVRIVSAVGDISLLDENGRIDTDVSDHLPIIASLQLEEG